MVPMDLTAPNMPLGLKTAVEITSHISLRSNR
jgi:hypothetical protein